ncbi:glycosyltransferase family 47 protein [Acinetobacter rathckeae]|uniref:hypothetical protein n=1 Tax=Acinetobacter rathckeae TaxID=2605272 RepID=UPI0018A25CC7|nr:hypothetical protein [Acinetobacter rathckeae]MBF7696388.1 hypothetical protein [Acinetobacter rathckeae]
MNSKNVIYQTPEGPCTDFEFEFIDKVLLSKIPHQNYFDKNQLSLYLDSPIIVYSSDSFFIDKKFKKYINKLNQPILIHLSNESQWHTTFYYNKAQAVIRTASWNIFTDGNVYSFPLGFQSGYLNKQNSVNYNNDRKYHWCFCGQVKSDRKTMLKNFTDIHPNFTFNNKGWLSNDSLSTHQLIDIYKNSIFALCPLGNINFECFRTMEALEYGCIPVTTEFLGRDCYKYIYGDHPFIVAKDWADAKNQVLILLTDQDALIKKQQEVWDWYTKFKIELSNDLYNIVNNDINNVKGKQFLYQKEVKSDFLFKLKFINHFFVKRVKKKLSEYIKLK